MEPIYNGARDTQTSDQKARNYSQTEFVSGPAPVTWVEKPQASWRKFSQRDQDSSGMCVVMTEATERGILALQKYSEWLDFSSSFLYQQRKYPTLAGCTSEDVYSIFPKIGDVFEKDMPSQLMNDVAAMAVPRLPYFSDVAKVFTAVRIQLPIDFETVASTVQQTGKGVMCWFHFSHDEWTATPQVLPQPTTSGHSVTVVDFTLVQGKKYLVIQDSWSLPLSMNGLRLISEEYFAARCFLASYLMNFQLQASAAPLCPHFDGSIVSAQECFKWEGFFPLNIADVENWGNITRAACIKFQIKYGITPAAGNFGPITKAKLLELYP
jgi:hypothetical protein